MTDIISLKKLRAKIDAIDNEILQHFNQRAHYALEVAKIKDATSEAKTFYCPDREALVLRRIKALNQGPLTDEAVACLFRELMSSCLALEKPLAVAFLGPEGTFTQQATIKHFGQAVQSVPLISINDIFTAVENQRCQFGVVPVENSTEGVVTHTLDRFVNSPLKICGEVEMRVHHHLMGNAENLNAIDEVFSHQQSLAQCQRWLDTHLPHATRTPVSSNAEAARLVSTCQHKMAIASEIAAHNYKLNILNSHIEDECNNTTRFIIVGQQESAPTGLDKTSLLISTNDDVGSMYKILEPFVQQGINLSHIESRPSKQGLWDYVFFIDIIGHKDDSNVSAALALLKPNVKLLNILGSYPKVAL